MTIVDPAVGEVFAAVISAVVYSMVWYGRARQEGESFDQRKFAATVLVGAVVGLSAGLAGQVVEFPTFQAKMAGYVGLISLVEGLLKMLNSWYKERQKTE